MEVPQAAALHRTDVLSAVPGAANLLTGAFNTMPKGLFTQCVCVLLEKAVTRRQIAAALRQFEPLQRLKGKANWELSGPTVVMEFRPETNGYVAVDIVNRRWPNQMGDPVQDPMLLGAWVMGNFGPFAFPGCLERAAKQSPPWSSAPAAVERHNAFIRIRCSYAFGDADDFPLIPDDYNPEHELNFLTRVASELLKLPSALCYFNPNGELLLDARMLSQAVSEAQTWQQPALDAWSRLRLFKVDSEQMLMDTVGNHQLDIPDLEVLFHSDIHKAEEIAEFLRSLTLQLLQDGASFDNDMLIDGPGNVRWSCQQLDHGTTFPCDKSFTASLSLISKH